MHDIDMHMHSTASDGTYSPEELAEMCAKEGLKYCALTDHDTVAGSEAYVKRCRELNINALKAVEFNTKYDGELHILGYGINLREKNLKKTLDELAEFREKRTELMVKKLNDAGIEIKLERVKLIAGSGVIGRPHIARALCEAGYAKDVEGAFKQFLNRGCVGYIERKSITSEEAISLINGAGGKAVFAHPGITAAPDTEKLVKELVSEGLSGIEAFYPVHTDKQVRQYVEIAKKYGLYITCGSDFHGVTRKTSLLHAEKRGGELLRDSVIRFYKLFD